MANKLIDLYTSMLDYAGLSVEKDGFVYYNIDPEHKEYLTVNGKNLVLPTEPTLKNPKPDSQIIFHPLAENTLRSESPVIMKLKSALNVRMNYMFGFLALDLFTMVLNDEHHSRMSPDQLQIMKIFKDVDETTKVNFTRLLTECLEEDYEKTFVNVFLKKGGTYHGKKYARVGIISFPMYVKLKEKGVNAYRTKLRNKDVSVILALYQYLFDNIETEESYNFGSDSNVAPYLDALYNSTIKVLGAFNTFAELYHDYLENPEKLISNSEWVDDFVNMESLIPLIRTVPPQPTGEVAAAVPTPQQSVVSSVPPPKFNTTNTPVVNQPNAGIQNGPVNTPIQQPIYQPQGYQSPMQQPAIVEPIKKTSRGLDFKSLMEHNPALAQGPNPLQGFMPMQPQMMMQQRQPSWATPNPMMGQMGMMPQQRMPGWAAPQPVMQPMYCAPQQPMYPNQPMYGNMGGVCPV